MKKAFVLLLAVGLLVVVMATTAVAVAPGDGVRDLAGAGSQAGNGHAWGVSSAVDSGVGIRDAFVDADGDGVCDNLVDADGDGINELRSTRGEGGHGPHGSGNCDGDGFVDADGDGACDNAGSGGAQQRMRGNS